MTTTIAEEHQHSFRTVAAAASAPPRMFGVNLSCAEFADKNLPGEYGKDYVYPNAGELDYYHSKGLYLIRVPFLWERMQPALFGPLDEFQLGKLDEVIAAARQRDMKVIPDPHNYARYGRGIIGSPEVPTAAFRDFWARLADHYRHESAIWAYGLVNEPHDMADLWPAAAQAGIDGIRSADMSHWILVPGDHWSGVANWIESNQNLSVNDAANRCIYEGHVYFDEDKSGFYRRSYDEEKAYPMIGVDRMKPFVAWLKERNSRGFMGEFGIPHDDPRWLVVLENFLSYVNDLGMSATYWAGGPIWGKYRLSIEPADGVDRPQMAVMQRFAAKVAAPTVG